MANEQGAPISFEQFERGLEYWGPRINRMHGELQGGRAMTRTPNARTATAGSKPNTTRSTTSATPARRGGRRKKAPQPAGAA